MSRMKQALVVLAAVTMVGALAVVNLSASGASTKTTARPTTSLTAPGSQWTVKHPFKAAFIYVGAPSDAGWTHAQDVGRLEVQKYFGGRVETVYKEDVPEGPQCASGDHPAGRLRARTSVFATSYGYQPQLVAAAAKYPNVLFEQATGTTVIQAPGRSTTAPARTATTSAAWPPERPPRRPATTRSVSWLPTRSPSASARSTPSRWAPSSIDPQATVKIVWTNTWFDPATERAAAESLVADGVSVLADGQDSPTTGQVAEAHGLKWIGYDSNQQSPSPPTPG